MKTAMSLAIAASVLIAACTGEAGRLSEQRLFAMGTWVDISVDTEDEDAQDAALKEIEAMLRSFERDYYAWADGELARVNDNIANRRAIEVSEDFAAILSDAQRLSLQSGGVFDPAVGALVELWGFHSDLKTSAAPPEQASIDAWLDAAPSIAMLDIDERVVSSNTTSLKLDLGGIAKGEAVDRMIQILQGHEISNAIVNAGGDLRAIGQRSGQAWRIGIRSARTEGLIAIVELKDGEAAFTSGDYERYFEFEGQRLHHILDPSTGHPADHTRAITVIAPNGMTADAAATALFVAGPERWQLLHQKYAHQRPSAPGADARTAL